MGSSTIEVGRNLLIVFWTVAWLILAIKAPCLLGGVVIFANGWIVL